jgi:hypothetical protein
MNGAQSPFYPTFQTSRNFLVSYLPYNCKILNSAAFSFTVNQPQNAQGVFIF